jgi:ABC-type branched-subunit amino acid transport system substrate-binding protein
MVGDASYVPADVDMSAQTLALKAANPDAVIMVCIGKQGALVLKEAQRLSWKPKFLAHNTMADPITYDLAGDALEGTSVLLFSATKNMNTPAVKEANAIVAKYFPQTQPGYWTSLGMGGAKAFVEAARRAGRDLTREKLVNALYSFNRYEPGVLPPVDWNRTSHGGAKAFGFAVWRKGGDLQVVQGW